MQVAKSVIVNTIVHKSAVSTPESFVVAAAKQDISRETVESISVRKQVAMAVVPVDLPAVEETSIKSIRNLWLRLVVVEVEVEAVDMDSLWDGLKMVDLVRGNSLSKLFPQLLLGYSPSPPVLPFPPTVVAFLAFSLFFLRTMLTLFRRQLHPGQRNNQRHPLPQPNQHTKPLHHPPASPRACPPLVLPPLSDLLPVSLRG